MAGKALKGALVLPAHPSMQLHLDRLSALLLVEFHDDAAHGGAGRDTQQPGARIPQCMPARDILITDGESPGWKGSTEAAPVAGGASAGAQAPACPGADQHTPAAPGADRRALSQLGRSLLQSELCR